MQRKLRSVALCELPKIDRCKSSFSSLLLFPVSLSFVLGKSKDAFWEFSKNPSGVSKTWIDFWREGSSETSRQGTGHLSSSLFWSCNRNKYLSTKGRCPKSHWSRVGWKIEACIVGRKAWTSIVLCVSGACKKPRNLPNNLSALHFLNCFLPFFLKPNLCKIMRCGNCSASRQLLDT